MRGVKVVELAGSAAGAYCARLFATAGADVVLVEGGSGGPLRGAPPLLEPPVGGQPGRSAVHEFLHAYKRGVVLEPDDTRVDGLFAWADLVISTSDGEPDAALALHERIAAANPAAAHVVLSGFGLTGRWRTWRTSGLVDWASGGHLFITGEPGREPLQGGGPWDSYLHGGTAALGAQGALFAARRTGRGDLVDVGAMESGAAGHQWSITMFTHTGVHKDRHANRMGEMHHPMALFPCSDGWVCIGAASREQWEHLCIAMDQVELLADEALYSPADRFDRADELDELFLPWLAARTADEVVQILQEARVPAGRVLTMSEVLDDAQLAARSYWATPEELGLAAKMPGVPFHVGDDLPFRSAPALGQHTDEVLAAISKSTSGSTNAAQQEVGR